MQKNGKRTELRKNYVTMSLSQARAWREEIRAKILSGEDISKSQQTTVENVCNQWLNRWRPEVSEKYGKQVESAIRRDVLPIIGSKNIEEVRPIHIVNSLKSFEKRGALEYLRRTKTGLNQLFDFAVSRGLIDMNPVASVSNKAFKKHKSKNFRALSPDDLPFLIKSIESAREDSKINETVYYCFFWQLLTMTRPGEAATAKWEHIDLKNKIWSIPASVMKMKRDHRVPLSDLLVDIAVQMKSYNANNIYVFESRSTHINKESVAKMLNRLSIDSTAHGLRALARTYLRETRLFKRDALEMCLAHITGSSTEQAYDRSELLKERSEIINYWSNIISELKRKNINNIKQ